MLHVGCAIVRYAQLSARNDEYTRFKSKYLLTSLKHENIFLKTKDGTFETWKSRLFDIKKSLFKFLNIKLLCYFAIKIEIKNNYMNIFI